MPIFSYKWSTRVTVAAGVTSDPIQAIGRCGKTGVVVNFPAGTGNCVVQYTIGPLDDSGAGVIWIQLVSVAAAAAPSYTACPGPVTAIRVIGGATGSATVEVCSTD